MTTKVMTEKYAVFGNPIHQSKSPVIHSQFAEQFGLDMIYSAVLVPDDQFKQQVEQFFQSGGNGLNITIPFKQQAFEMATELTAHAQIAKAVNTLKWDGQLLFGDNTDGRGLVKDLVVNLKWSIKGQRVLILGAGGAVRGVVAPLLDQEPESIVIANRTLSKAEDIVSDVLRHYPEANISALPLDQLNEPYDLIINGTSTGLNQQPIEVAGSIFLNACCYDMVYGHEPTAFMTQANRLGAKEAADGSGMLIEQAGESFYWWTGNRPETHGIDLDL